MELEAPKIVEDSQLLGIVFGGPTIVEKSPSLPCVLYSIYANRSYSLLYWSLSVKHAPPGRSFAPARISQFPLSMM